jgi:hypothetical protein
MNKDRATKRRKMFFFHERFNAREIVKPKEKNNKEQLTANGDCKESWFGKYSALKNLNSALPRSPGILRIG